MGLLDDIKNAIFSFFSALGNFLINILTTIKDKLLDFISWLANGLWSLFLTIFNKVKDAINDLFVKPLTNFTNRVLNRFYQKIDGMMMILVGVPLTWKAVENFINDPSKKRFMFIPLALVFSWFISKIVGQIIKQYMGSWISKGVSLPSVPSVNVPQLPSIKQIDSLINDAFNYGIKPAPYITDRLISENVSLGIKPASVFGDVLTNDKFNSLIKSGNIYQIKQLDNLLDDPINTTSGKIVMTLSDNLNMNDIINYVIGMGTRYKASDSLLNDKINYVIGMSTRYKASDSLLNDIGLKNALQTTYKASDSLLNDIGLNNALQRTFTDNLGLSDTLNYNTITNKTYRALDNMLVDAVSIGTVNVSITDISMMYVDNESVISVSDISMMYVDNYSL